MPLLAQISPNDPISTGAVLGLSRHSSLFNLLDFSAVGGNSVILQNRQYSPNTTIFRDINEDNTSTPPGIDDQSVIKRIVSFDASADVTLEDRDIDPTTVLAQRTVEEAENASWLLQTAFIHGAYSAQTKSFDGLLALTPQANYKDTGKPCPVGNDNDVVSAMQEAIEQLLFLQQMVLGGATHAVVNDVLKVRFLTMAKQLGYYRMSKDELGAEVDQIGSLTLVGAGMKADGSYNLPFDASTKKTSIIVFRQGTKGLKCITSKGVVGRYTGQVGNKYVNNVNLDAALALDDSKGMFVSTGWSLSSL